MVYENCKIYGPYKRKQDGRSHITIVYPDGRKSSVSYPKFLVESRTGKYLGDNETIDHLDMNFNNNAPTNLDIKDRKIHAVEDVKRYEKQSFMCPQCNTQFSLVGMALHWAIVNRKRGKAGPFCGRSCAGKYSKDIQTGKKNPLKVKNITPKYTSQKLSLLKETSEVDAAKTGKP